MDDGERIGIRRIIRLNSIEVFGEEKSRAVPHGLPETGMLVGPWERLPVGLQHSRSLPAYNCAHSRLATSRTVGKTDLIAPALATPVIAPLQEVLSCASQRVIRRAKGRNSPITVKIDTHVQPDCGHPLSVSHRACPRPYHVVGCAPSALNNDERV